MSFLRSIFVVLFAFSPFVLVAGFQGCATGTAVAVFESGDSVSDTLDIPVTTEIADLPFNGAGDSDTGILLKPVGGGRSIPAQIVPNFNSSKGQTWRVATILPAGLDTQSASSKRFKIHRRNALKSAFKLQEENGHTLAVYEGQRLVLKYRYDRQEPPAGIPEDRARACYVSPILGLDGEVFTDDFPTDHHHHRGLFWAWPTFTACGETHDHWHIDGAWTRFERWLSRDAGPVCASLQVQNGWYVGDRKVGTERLNLTVWRSNDIGQAIDVELTWETDETVTISGRPEKGYGGFSLRFADRKNPVVNFPEGPQENSDMKHSPWGDMSGIFNGRGEVSGLSIFVHPDNPDFPPGWTVRTKAEYGFLGASWPGTDTCTITPGNPVTAKHRIWVHRGDLQKGQVREAYRLYPLQDRTLSIQGD